MDPVTVVVPSYNETTTDIMRTVDAAIRARAEAVILIDDGSAERPRLPPRGQLEYYRIEHRGISAAVNEGFRQATTPLVAWCSVGDVYHADKLVVQTSMMRSARALASFTDYLDTQSGDEVRTSPHWQSRLWTDNQFSLSTAVLHRSVWQAVGGLDESLQWCQDWDFACKVHAECGWLYVASSLMAGAVCAPGRHSYRGNHGVAKALRDRDKYKVTKRWRDRGRGL